MTQRIHSTRAVALGSLLKVEQSAGPKPRGLWWAVGRKWVEWCRVEKFRTDTLKRHYQLDLDDSKLLVIGRDMSLDQFDAKYAYEDPRMAAITRKVNEEIGDRIRWNPRYHIDWPKVAQAYCGIEIPVYSWEHRHDLMWYYGWDVASGCLWDQSALRGYAKIRLKEVA